jgi:hypothetical protein
MSNARPIMTTVEHACTRHAPFRPRRRQPRVSAIEFKMAKSNKKGGTSGSSQTGKSKRKGK